MHMNPKSHPIQILKLFMLNIFFILTIDTSIYGFSFLQSEHETPSAHPHILYGIPKGTSTSNYYIKRKIYTLSSNNGTKMADWVAYIVTLSHFDCDENTSRSQNSEAIPRTKFTSPVEKRRLFCEGHFGKLY